MTPAMLEAFIAYGTLLLVILITPILVMVLGATLGGR
jgi:hypothetical protein